MYLRTLSHLILLAFLFAMKQQIRFLRLNPEAMSPAERRCELRETGLVGNQHLYLYLILGHVVYHQSVLI